MPACTWKAGHGGNTYNPIPVLVEAPWSLLASQPCLICQPRSQWETLSQNARWWLSGKNIWVDIWPPQVNTWIHSSCQEQPPATTNHSQKPKQSNILPLNYIPSHPSERKSVLVLKLVPLCTNDTHTHKREGEDFIQDSKMLIKSKRVKLLESW